MHCWEISGSNPVRSTLDIVDVNIVVASIVVVTGIIIGVVVVTIMVAGIKEAVVCCGGAW